MFDRQDTIQNLYQVTFTLGIFFLLIIEKFFSSAGAESSMVVLQWGSWICLLVIAYIFYTKNQHYIPSNSKLRGLIEGVLITNLILITLEITYLGLAESIGRWDFFISFFLTAHTALLIFIAFVLPLALIFLQCFPRQINRFFENY